MKGDSDTVVSVYYSSSKGRDLPELGEYRLHFANDTVRSFFILPREKLTVTYFKSTALIPDENNAVLVNSSLEMLTCLQLASFNGHQLNHTRKVTCFRGSEQEKQKKRSCRLLQMEDEVLTVQLASLPPGLDEETFTLQCWFDVGYKAYSVMHRFKVKLPNVAAELSLSPVALAGIGVLALVFFVAFSLAIYSRASRRRSSNRSICRLESLHQFPEDLIPSSIIVKEEDSFEEESSLLEVEPELEVEGVAITVWKEQDVQYIKLVGRGNYGEVWSGRLTFKRTRLPIAIKRCLTMDPESQKDLLHEARMMTGLRHDNVVELMGVYCLGGDSADLSHAHAHGLLFLKYTSGSLKDYLSRNKKLDVGESIKYLWSYQIASGMSYLASQEIVHFDLAARNILLQDPDKDASIADFGLARRLEEGFPEDKQLPFRSHAPEVLLPPHSVTPGTDVWSYGVLLWEIFSHGEDPYSRGEMEYPRGAAGSGYELLTKPIKSSSLKEISDLLLRGFRLQSPFGTSEHPVYKLMLLCWNLSVSERPSFSDLAASFKDSTPDQRLLVRRTENLTNYNQATYTTLRVKQADTVGSKDKTKYISMKKRPNNTE